MILVIGLIIGLVCGMIAAKKAGFVSAWARLFNTGVAVYIAVYMTPTIAASASIVGQNAIGPVLCACILAIVMFVILNTICSTIMGDLKIEMTRLLDSLGGGVLGFANGMLVWGFLCLLLCISPLAESSFVKQTTAPEEVMQMWNSSMGANVAILGFLSCDSPRPVGKVVEAIKKMSEPKPKLKTGQPETNVDGAVQDSNSPAEPGR
jgi:uncharacterized membrane protein required for colicin V production